MDRDMLEYFMQMGQLRADEDRTNQLRARANALRAQPQIQGGQQFGKHIVPTTSAAGYSNLLSQLGGAAGSFMADRQSNATNQQRLEALRKLSAGSYGNTPQGELFFDP